MAKTKLNPALERIQGKIGDLVFKKHGDINVVARKPDLAGRLPTPSQEAQRERFKRAAAWAHSTLADPLLKTKYTNLARTRNVSPFALCVQDYLVPPRIHTVDLSLYTGGAGQPIRILATDPAGVESVRVSILAADGGLVEQGDAVRQPGDVWLYTTTATVPTGQAWTVTVAAADRPGNVVTWSSETP